MKVIIYSFLFTFCLIPSIGVTQDIQLSQYYNVSPLINPAFAGTSYALRAIVNTRAQWQNLDAKYLSAIVSIDYNSQKYNSGIGLYALHDEQGNNSIVRNEVAAQYAYSIALKKGTYIRMALQSSYNQRKVGDNYVFPNQFNGNGFNAGLPTSDNQRLAGERYLDLGSGALLYSNSLWLGFSAFHMNRPNQSLTGTVDRIERTYNIIGGYKIIIKKIPTMRYLLAKDIEVLSITPTLNFKTQGKSNQLDMGIYGVYNPVMLGLWYRGIPLIKTNGQLANNESLIFLIGFNLDQFAISYSFDNTISRLGNTTGGAQELNIIYQFPSHRKRNKNTKYIPCPSFNPLTPKTIYKNTKKKGERIEENTDAN
jgi:type IX secretion system PorP/SprF family membrane protein